MKGAIAAIAAVTAGASGIYYASVGAEPAQTSHSVKVELERGHGSATHIGNGYFLTASHVVRGQDGIVIRTRDEQVAPAVVLWDNPTYDVALIYAEIEGLDAASVSCVTPDRGDSVMLSGNPLNLSHIDTWGRVSGDTLRVGDTWRSVVPVNAVIAQGMSGGGAFSDDGDLIGVNVGVMVAPVTPMSGSFIGIAYVVPGSVVCHLMGIQPLLTDASE